MSFKTEEVGDRIKKFREMRNFTQEHVAQELKMTPQGYGKIERNEVDITIQRLSNIAKILDTTIPDIFGFDESFVFHNQECKYYGVNHTQAEFIKEVYESRITDLQAEIQYLRGVLEKTLGQ